MTAGTVELAGARASRLGEAADRVRQAGHAPRAPPPSPAARRRGGSALRGTRGYGRDRRAALYRSRNARRDPPIQGDPVRHRIRSGERCDGPVRRCGSHPRLRDHQRPRGRPDARVLGQPRAQELSDPSRPHASCKRGLRAHRVDVRRARARARSAGSRRPRRDRERGARRRRCPAGAVVRRRSDAGHGVGARPASRGGPNPHVPLFLDSPMASKATDIYKRHPEYFDEEMRSLLARRDDPSITQSRPSRTTPRSRVRSRIRLGRT
jgi:hypothetical protein